MIFYTLLFINFILAPISHNESGKRRLGQVIGQREALTPAPTVAEQNRAEGCKPEHGFVEPSRPAGRRTFTVC